MANWSDPRLVGGVPSAASSGDVVYDAGLRSYMIAVYRTMAGGVLLTGLVAWALANSSLMGLFFHPENGGATALGWVAMLSPLVFVMVLSFGINRLSSAAARALFWTYAAVMGLSLSTIFIVYSGASIATAFFATATAFAALSLFGYTTRRDLSGLGVFFLMGVVGIFVAMILNMLIFKSAGMDLAISIIGVLLFAGLTAYDTQKIKSLYFQVSASQEAVNKTIVMGALSLYLDFINMFLFLLRIFGSRD